MIEVIITDRKGNKGSYTKYESEKEFMRALRSDRTLRIQCTNQINRIREQDAKNALFHLWNKK